MATTASGLDRLLRVWRTVRPLRPVQLFGRVRHLGWRPRPDTSPASELRAAGGPWANPPAPEPSMLPPDAFRFLGVERRLACAADWNRADWPKLWLYNLHYFDDLLARDAAQRRDAHLALMDRWLRENPPGLGNGWEPYCLSRRIVNWVKAAHAGFPLSAPLRHSLAVQTRYLGRRIEWHLLGNHLFENARALIFAGAFFQGPEAQAWLQLGRRILLEQLDEQVLPDGGHFELSPMYHAIVLEGTLDLVNLAQRQPGVLAEPDVERLRSVCARMLAWLHATIHPDGEIALLNDAAFGIASPPSAITQYAARLGVAGGPMPPPDVVAGPAQCVWLAASGYVRLSCADAFALLDVGEIGPEYLPGHAHADSLSFELSIGGHRVVVDSGTSTYAADAERLRQRGTAAHNTVVVDDADSSEVWSSFRVARRARPVATTVDAHAAMVRIRAGHDGYRRLPGRVTHRREWRFDGGHIDIDDRIEGRFQSARARVHLHPAVDVRHLDAQHLALTLPDGRRIHVSGRHPLRREPGSWHPRFGTSEPTQVIVQDCIDGTAGLRISWGDAPAARDPTSTKAPI